MLPPDLPRLPHWPVRLAEYLSAQRAQPFGWGRMDCVTFALGAARAITGQQLQPVCWASVQDAAQALRARGGLAGAVDAVLPRLPRPTLAQRGDVLLVRQARAGRAARQWLAVADAGGWCAPGAHGLVRGPIDQAVLAWRVGVPRG